VNPAAEFRAIDTPRSQMGGFPRHERDGRQAVPGAVATPLKCPSRKHAATPEVVAGDWMMVRPPGLFPIWVEREA
jgi:hypothetical protein